MAHDIHGPILQTLEAEVRGLVTTRLADNGPYTIAMVKRVQRSRKVLLQPQWWDIVAHLQILFNQQAYYFETFYEDVEVEPVMSAHFEEKPDRVAFVVDSQPDHWEWDGQGEFREFVVCDRDGVEVMRGGRLTATPIKGSHIAPEIWYGLPMVTPQ